MLGKKQSGLVWERNHGIFFPCPPSVGSFFFRRCLHSRRLTRRFFLYKGGVTLRLEKKRARTLTRRTLATLNIPLTHGGIFLFFFHLLHGEIPLHEECDLLFFLGGHLVLFSFHRLRASSRFLACCVCMCVCMCVTLCLFFVDGVSVADVWGDFILCLHTASRFPHTLTICTSYFRRESGN